MKLVSTLRGILDGTVKISDRKKYSILTVAVAGVHLALSFIFYFIGSVPMTIYNCLSVMGYLFCLKLIKKNALSWVYAYICVEVPLHSLLATYTAGWDFGFAMYLIAIVPVGFEMSFALKDTAKGIKASMLFGFINLVAFMSCRIYSYNCRPFCNVDNMFFVKAVYTSNIVCTFVLLLIY